MEGGIDPQSGYQQREPELDIPPLQSMGVQFKTSFSEPMMFKPTFIAGPSTQSSFTESSSELAFTKATHFEIQLAQTPLALDHAPLMDLSALISSLSTHMKEFAVVSDTRFYSMEDCMDQYQVGITSQFEYLQQMIDRIKDRLERQHEKMIPYLHFMFPPPQP